MAQNRFEQRLAELGIVLPDAPAPVAAYVGVVRTGNLVMTSGQLPWKEGVLAFRGRLGAELSESAGHEAARLCAVNALAQIKRELGTLDRVRRVVRVEGYVHSSPGFRGQPQVLNGASLLLNDVFGDAGKHTRIALGISEMPLDAAVQLVIWVEAAE
jgi:enamine deaminase RidA (YjgF/YER057c/UK114 family)